MHMASNSRNGNGVQGNSVSPHPDPRLQGTNPEDNVFPTAWFAVWFSLSLMLPFVVAPLLGFLTPQQTTIDSLWWRRAMVYRMDVNNFRGMDGERRQGIADLKKELPSMQSSGVGAIWLGDTLGIQPGDTNTEEFRALVRDIHNRGMRILLDFVPNHTPVTDEKFQNSRKARSGPYGDFYVWHDGQRTADSKRQPPNNWKAGSGGSAWTYDDHRDQYYLHQSRDKMFPDLNYSNPAVREYAESVLVFWLKQDVDGIVIRDAHKLVEADLELDEPPSFVEGMGKDYRLLKHHVYTQHQPETFNIIKSWVDIVASFNGDTLDNHRLLVAEVQDNPIDTDWKAWSHYYDTGLAMPLNYQPLKIFRPECDCLCMEREISAANWSVPEFRTMNWVLPTPMCVHNDLERNVPLWELDSKRYTLLSVLHMLLPGTPILSDTHDDGCDSKSPIGDRTHRALLSALAQLRLREGLFRGHLHIALTQKHLLSLVRHASGLLIPWYLVILNFGPQAIHENFSMRIDKVNIPQAGKVVFEASGSKFNERTYDVNITSLTVEPMQAFVIQF